MYEKLTHICPDVQMYRIYQAQSLLKAGALPEANRAVMTSRTSSSNNNHSERLSMLQANIQYESDDLISCKKYLADVLQDDPECILAYAAIDFREGSYTKALLKYSEALNILGYDPDILYCKALCYYKLNQFDHAVELLKEIISTEREKYPEFQRREDDNDGTDDDENESIISNSRRLQASYLVESYNLMAAIKFNSKNIDEAKTILDEMPKRREDELDPVTLHNYAIVNMDANAFDGFQKLKHLLSHPPFPPETYGNILLLYCKYGHHNLAADIMAENSNLSYDSLSQELYDYLDASVMISVNKEEAFGKFESMSKQCSSRLKKMFQSLPEATLSNNQKLIDELKSSIDNELKIFIPVTMSQAKIYWDAEDYVVVEKILKRCTEFCSDHDAWRLNLGHVYFIQQGTKFKDAINYYDPFVRENGSKRILGVAAIILANLCVAYIMTNKNEEASICIFISYRYLSYNEFSSFFFSATALNFLSKTMN